MAIESVSIGFSGMDFGARGGFSGVQSPFKGGSANEMEKIPAFGDGSRSGENGTPNSKISDEADKKRRFDSYECQTCKYRRYQDGSDDSGVSYQTPTRIDPSQAGAAVRSHEQEHVSRNKAKAEREGSKIVFQSVTIHTAVCPECGRTYVSGGTTRTVTKTPFENKYNVGFSTGRSKGGKLNKIA